MPQLVPSRRRTLGALVGAAVAAAGLVAPAGPAAAATIPRVELRVLVVSDGGPSTEALATQLERQGVPATRVDLDAADRPRLTADFLADPASRTAHYQAVVLPRSSGAGLAAEELTALRAYEREYGIRQVNAYEYPSAAVGLQPPAFSGSLDGITATVTPVARAGAFSSLRGPLPVDDFGDALEVYGYLAQPVGAAFTPYVTATAGGTSGVLAGVHAADGREELVLTAGYNASMQWFSALAPSVVRWMTRGTHLGYARNHFAVQVDDVLLPDSRWSTTDDCTPGDGCVDPSVTTPDIRMTAADVERLRAWQRSRGFRLDLAFNGGGSAAWRAEHGGRDPLADALVAAQDEFSWINHTSTHPFLGCIQIAPTVQGEPWTCATSPTQTPRQDPDVPQALSDGTYWASRAFITEQITDNNAWAERHGLEDYDPTELVTGEHSGLRTLPQQRVDNPFLAPALRDAGVRTLASDASREPSPRAVGAARTVPRHPMNVYYNTATYRELMDEYLWYYTSRADGGGGVCEDNPATSTCIAPLPIATEAEARASFEGYLVPLEVRNALRAVLSNDPRPFYSHQSNLAEDGLLYPVLDGVLADYARVHDTATTPLVTLDLTGQSQALARMAAWRAADDATTAWVDATGVHVPDADVQVPVTVPLGSRVTGAALDPYAGQLSGWASGGATAALPVVGGGFAGLLVAPGAPPVVRAVPLSPKAVVVGWLPADAGSSPVTSYRVRTYAGAALTPTATMTVPGTARLAVVHGLSPSTTYRFDVLAVNAAGEGPPSASTAAMRPRPPKR